MHGSAGGIGQSWSFTVAAGDWINVVWVSASPTTLYSIRYFTAGGQDSGYMGLDYTLGTQYVASPGSNWALAYIGGYTDVYLGGITFYFQLVVSFESFGPWGLLSGTAFTDPYADWKTNPIVSISGSVGDQVFSVSVNYASGGLMHGSAGGIGQSWSFTVAAGDYINKVWVSADTTIVYSMRFFTAGGQDSGYMGLDYTLGTQYVASPGSNWALVYIGGYTGGSPVYLEAITLYFHIVVGPPPPPEYSSSAGSAAAGSTGSVVISGY